MNYIAYSSTDVVKKFGISHLINLSKKRFGDSIPKLISSAIKAVNDD